MYDIYPAVSKEIFKSEDRHHHGSNAFCTERVYGPDGRCQSVLLASVYDRSCASYVIFHLRIVFHRSDRCSLWSIDRICCGRIHGFNRMAGCLLLWYSTIGSMVERMVSSHFGIRIDQCDSVQDLSCTFPGRRTDGDWLERMFVSIFDRNIRVCCQQHQLSHGKYTIFRKVFI